MTQRTNFFKKLHFSIDYASKRIYLDDATFIHPKLDISGKSSLIWTDFVLSLIVIGGLLTAFVTGSVDLGGMSAVIEKARQQNHFHQDTFSFNPFAQVCITVFD